MEPPKEEKVENEAKAEGDIAPHEEVVEKSPRERYLRFKDLIGKGSYKEVWRAYDSVEGIEVAWNVVNLKTMPPNEKARVINEVRLLDRLEHENIIDFHGSWVNRERGEVCFITEILSSGSLKKFINKVQVVRWKIIKRWVRQILKALAYLHSQTPPIIHRDIKCENIFINGSTGDLRIGDLGLSTAKKVNEGKGQSVLGTPEFMAPELYDEEYDEKVDVFAFGMCVLEMITKQLPYSECTNATQIYRKVCGNVPPDALRLIPDDKALDFVKGCIQKDPAERLGAAELLKHDFLVPDPNFGETEVRLRSPSDLPPIADRQAGRSQGAASVETRDSGGAGSTLGSEWSPPKEGKAEAFPAELVPAAPAPAEGARSQILKTTN